MRRSATITAALALLVMDVTASAAESRPPSTVRQAASPTSSLPRDYRVRIADYIRDRNRHVVRDAKITAPYERWGGLFKGGTFTALCVAIFRDNPFGIVVRDNYVFDFDGDRVRPVAMGMERCEPLTPFPELMRALAAPPAAR
ncbi:hypothetical protein ACVIIV_000110 [Bradyrhizobium sp. USDA 4354]